MDNNLFKKCTGHIKFDYNLAHLTWLKVGGEAEVFYKPRDIHDLQNFITSVHNSFNISVIGAGSNLLIRDYGIKGVTIKLGRSFNYIKKQDNNLVIGAATLNSSVVKFCLENEIGGFEFLAGIPGSIGGGIAMNAGAYNTEFKDIVSFVVGIRKNGQFVFLKGQDMEFEYRFCGLKDSLVFLEVYFDLTKRQTDNNKQQIREKINQIETIRKLSQPINQKTAGSLFKNPLNEKAWSLIDKVGMRGFTLRGAQISQMHCNFLINQGNATATDLELVAEMSREKVLECTGIDLQWEIQRVGERRIF